MACWAGLGWAGLGWPHLGGGEHPIPGGIQAKVGGLLAGAPAEQEEVMSVPGSRWL